jgi:hypothetical protein
VSEFPGTDLELDLLSLVLRLGQLDREAPPDHFLWRTRIIECDVARLRRKWITPAAQEYANAP